MLLAGSIREVFKHHSERASIKVRDTATPCRMRGGGWPLTLASWPCCQTGFLGNSHDWFLTQASGRSSLEIERERLEEDLRVSSSRTGELESELELLRSTEEARIQEYAALGKISKFNKPFLQPAFLIISLFPCEVLQGLTLVLFIWNPHAKFKITKD